MLEPLYAVRSGYTPWYRVLVFLTGILVVGEFPLHAQELITNGSFEVDTCSTSCVSGDCVLGWFFLGTTHLSSTEASDGARSILVNEEPCAPSSIPLCVEQSFPTTVNETYVLTFDMKAVDSTNALTVYVGDRVLNLFEGSSTGWIQQQVQFTASSDTTFLQFWPTGGGTNTYVDNVSVTCACSVDGLSPLAPAAVPFENAADPSTCAGLVDINNLDPVMLASVTVFEFELLLLDDESTFTITSAYRPAAYQAHLYNIRTRFTELAALKGVTVSVINKRPQLEVALPPAPDTLVCLTLIEKVNEEILKHCLPAGKGKHKAPPVNPPGLSWHEDGLAVDISITTSLSAAQLAKVAKAAGLFRPCKTSDPVHYQLLVNKKCHK